jgi:hypothetical protein
MLLLAGCNSPGASVAPPTDLPEATGGEVPEAFHEAHPAFELGAQAGGISLRHEFSVEEAANLRLVVAWQLPEPAVNVQIARDGVNVYSQILPVVEESHVNVEVLLEPGDYEVLATLYGVGLLKDFTMDGTFGAA